MTGTSALAAVAVLCTALAAALVAGRVVRPTQRLAGRVRPYTVTARSSLGMSADVRAVARADVEHATVRRLFAPLLESLAGRLGRLADASSDDALLLQLRQGRLLTDVPDDRKVLEYRVRQVLATLGGLGVGLALGLILPVSAATALLLAGAGLLTGATRWKGRLDRAVDDRRTRMRIELYTVNQLLAINIRVGGGIVQALRRVSERGGGVLIDELRDLLHAHEAGMTVRDALARAAAESPEPYVARTYRLLAAGAEHGADLAGALLEHSEDIRESRREALRRAATKRRAAMLVPTIAVLAPVMLLFVGAPLPSLIFGGLP